MLDAHAYLCVDGARVTQTWLKPCLMYMCLFVCWWGRGHTGLAATLLDVHAYLCVGGAGVTRVNLA